MLKEKSYYCPTCKSNYELSSEIISLIAAEVDRSILANLVFDKPDKLTQLNAVIHPEVRKMFELFAKKNSSSPYVLHEAAILVETGYYKMLDKLILVVADADLRVDRVMKRDNVTRDG